MKYNELFDTLQILTGRKPSATELAEIIGVPTRTLYTRGQRNSSFSLKEIQKIEDFFGFKLIDNSLTTNDYIELEHIHLKPSCGAGTLVIDEPDITPVQIGKSTLESLYKVSDYRYLKTFIASGDSMYDTISDGDMVLVDTSKINCANGGVFLFTKNNDWFIKRLRLRMNGDLEIISDNKKYGAPEVVKPTDDIEINIIGRVLHNLSKVL